MFKVKIILQLNMTPKLKSFKFSLMRPILKCLIFNVVHKKNLKIVIKKCRNGGHTSGTVLHTENTFLGCQDVVRGGGPIDYFVTPNLS